MATGSATSLTGSVDSSICTCCKCGLNIPDDDDEGDEDQDICIVEGSLFDKSRTSKTQEMTKSVWGGVKPPNNLGQYQPVVSARRTEIIRAQLSRKSKPQKSTSRKTVCQNDASKISFAKLSISHVM